MKPLRLQRAMILSMDLGDVVIGAAQSRLRRPSLRLCAAQRTIPAEIPQKSAKRWLGTTGRVQLDRPDSVARGQRICAGMSARRSDTKHCAWYGARSEGYRAA